MPGDIVLGVDPIEGYLKPHPFSLRARAEWQPASYSAVKSVASSTKQIGLPYGSCM